MLEKAYVFLEKVPKNKVDENSQKPISYRLSLDAREERITLSISLI